MNLKMPYGISNYEELVTENYYYVDKTEYIEKLEELPEKRIMFLRPRKFGKTLFTSVLENYYDKNKKESFEKLYGNTYIGKNPTKLKNSYCILRFNFSGIDTSTEEATIRGFKKEVASSIEVFINRFNFSGINTENEETTMKGFKEKVTISIEGFTKKYGIEFYINPEQTVEGMTRSLIEAFKIQKPQEKIYIIIDEYDHFANELLGFNPEQFRGLVSKNGKVRKWYEILKEGTETVVDRIFITGVAPITLDSLTSGFNIGTDITQDEEFNEMIGFTEEELKEILKNQEISLKEQEKIIPIMKENYDGYKFCLKVKNQIYNSNMCLYFLSRYIRLGEIPDKLIDTNIASDYSKIGKMLDLCKGENRLEILRKTVQGEPIVNTIIEKFNPAIEFTENDMISMLYYLGYLTISGEDLGKPELTIPNKVMKEIYADYFMQMMDKEAEFRIDNNANQEILIQLAQEGRIDKIVEILKIYLNNLSNRDLIKFDEKYIKLIFYCIAMNIKAYSTKSEMEVNRNYPDILLVPRDSSKGYKAVMVEFKYIKKGEVAKLEDKQKEAREQIERYSSFEDIKDIQGLRKYTIVVATNDIYVEEIV